MTPQSEFLQLLGETAMSNCKLGSKISTKELSPGNSLYMELGQGYAESQFYTKTGTWVFPVLFLCRNTDQRCCLDQLSDICNYFQRLKSCPKGTLFSWMDTEVAKAPGRVGRDEDGAYHYSCILNCKLYF